MVSRGRRLVLCGVLWSLCGVMLSSCGDGWCRVVAMWYVTEDILNFGGKILDGNADQRAQGQEAVVWCRVALKGRCVTFKGRRFVSCGI